MQAQQEEIRRALREATVEASSGDGLVHVRMRGDRVLRTLTLDENHPLYKDREALEDHIVLAMNQAMEKATAAEQQIMQQWMSRMLPGGLDQLKGLFGR